MSENNKLSGWQAVATQKDLTTFMVTLRRELRENGVSNNCADDSIKAAMNALRGTALFESEIALSRAFLDSTELL